MLLIDVLKTNDDPEVQLDILKGINAALEGRRRQSPPPPAWATCREALSRSRRPTSGPRPSRWWCLRRRGHHSTAMRKTLPDPRPPRRPGRHSSRSWPPATPGSRSAARTPGRSVSARGGLQGLASYDDPEETPERILSRYDGFYTDAAARRVEHPRRTNGVRQALAAPSARGDVRSGPHCRHAPAPRPRRRQDIDAFMDEVWGVARTSSKEKTEPMEKSEGGADRRPRPQPPTPPMASRCSPRRRPQCHTLYGVGGKVGPDLTGSNRPDLDYVLKNVSTPAGDRQGIPAHSGPHEGRPRRLGIAQPASTR